jgi:uncharacterized protein HemX
MENPPETESRQNPEPETPGQYAQRFRLSSLEILFGSLILLGLFYVGYLIFLQDGSNSPAKLEKKLKAIEAGAQEQANKFDKQTKQLLSVQTQLEARIKDLEKANHDLLAQIKRIEKRSAGEKKRSRGKEKNH